MWILLLVAVMYIGANGSNLNCPKYICTDSIHNVCAKHITEGLESSFFLSPCKEKKVCDIVDFHEEEVCKDSYSVAMLFPGEYCRSNSECYSHICNNKTNQCYGAPVGSDCQTGNDCKEGLYCFDHKCKETLKEDMTCDQLNMCSSPFICDLGKCVMIGSKSNEAKAQVPAACASFFIENGVCTTGPKLSQKNNSCPEDGVCKYAMADSKPFTEPCRCGMTNSSKTFCNPGRGDIDSQKVSN